MIGPAKIGAKVVLWSETRTPKQTWRIDSFGRICSQLFDNMIVDVKGKSMFVKSKVKYQAGFPEDRGKQPSQFVSQLLFLHGGIPPISGSLLL